MREYSIGKMLVERYLHQPYAWFLNKNSSDLGKNILSEVHQVIYQIIVPMMNLIAQGAITFALLILLIIIDTKLAMNRFNFNFYICNYLLFNEKLFIQKWFYSFIQQ